MVDSTKYPFMYSNLEELYAIIKWIKKNYEKAQEKMRPFTEKFIADHDISKAAQGYREVMEKSCADTWMPFKEWNDKFRRVLIDLPIEFTFDEFVKRANTKYKAQFGNYVVMIGAYRNLYRWLCDHVDPVVGSSDTFRQR